MFQSAIAYELAKPIHPQHSDLNDVLAAGSMALAGQTRASVIVSKSENPQIEPQTVQLLVIPGPLAQAARVWRLAFTFVIIGTWSGDTQARTFDRGDHGCRFGIGDADVPFQLIRSMRNRG